MDIIELTPLMLLLIPLVAAILQAVKQVPFIVNRSWLIPFIGMPIGVGLCFVFKDPLPWGDGILIGLSAVGLYEAGKGGIKAIANAPVIILLCCLLLGFSGCTNLVQWTPACDVQVRNAYSGISRTYIDCQAGDRAACESCLQMAVIESKFLKDGLTSKEVKMDKAFQTEFLKQDLRLTRLNEMCGAGDANACRDGARIGVNEIGIILQAVDNVPATVKY